MAILVTIVGGLFAVAGGATEALGVLAMVCWPLRRRLGHPFDLVGLGFWVWLGGVLVFALGRMLR